MSEIPPRIFLRPLGSPLTIGVSGLAIASLVESGLDLGWISSNQVGYAGLIMVTVPFILQLIACVFSYLARDGAAGAALGVLATSWLALGVVQIVGGGRTSGALGLMLVAAGGVLTLSALAVALAKPLPGVVLVLAAARFVLTGVYQLSSSGTVQDAAGVVGLVVTGLAAYSVLAFELEGQQRKPVLPTFRRARGAASVGGTDADQLDGIEHEAGIRQTT